MALLSTASLLQNSGLKGLTLATSASRDYERIYNGLLPIQYQHGTEERRILLRLCVDVNGSLMPGSGGRKDLTIEVKDDTDPFFFYSLKITEEDYAQLKSQQGLLVDFSVFPSRLVSLLEKCSSDDNSDSPKFLLLMKKTTDSSLKTGSNFLEIVETNPFKHLCHLSLKLSEGSDIQLRKHVTESFRALKDEKEQLSSTLQQRVFHLEQQLDSSRNLLSQKSSELEQMRGEWQAQLRNLQDKLHNESQAKKDQALQMEEDVQTRIRQERKEVEDRYKALVQSLETRANSLESQNKELLERKVGLENNLRDKEKQLSVAEEDNLQLRQELSLTRQQGSTLDSECHSKDKIIHQVRARVVSLEQEIKDKDTLCARQQELLSTAHQQRIQLEQHVQQKEATLKRRENAVQTMTEELVKANEIIQKLQSQLRILNDKAKLHGNVATEQEKVLQQKEAELTELRQLLKKREADYNFKVDEAHKLNEELVKAKTTLDLQATQLKTNDNVITWLNKQLNDLTIGKKVDTDNPATPGYPYFSTPMDTAKPEIPEFNRRPMGEISAPSALDPKYLKREPKDKTSAGILRSESVPTEKHAGIAKSSMGVKPKPSAYFKKT